jgi:Family of unknown function (DUF6526)
MAEQNLANHTKYFPPFHFFVMPVLLVNLGRSLYVAWKFPLSFATIFGILFALALVLGFLSARLFALSVQDRVIRGSASSHRGIHAQPVRFAAIRKRCGIAGVGTEGPRRQDHGTQSHQAVGEELAPRLSARMMGASEGPS